MILGRIERDFGELVWSIAVMMSSFGKLQDAFSEDDRMFVCLVTNDWYWK